MRPLPGDERFLVEGAVSGCVSLATSDFWLKGGGVFLRRTYRELWLDSSQELIRNSSNERYLQRCGGGRHISAA
eukprot:6704979-Alexandrium_andersonii.AAC.1